jgi:Mannose-6-phosphate isomerase
MGGWFEILQWRTPMSKRVEKPWGYEEIWARTDQYVGKIIRIWAGHRLSLQYHREKEETIRVLEGQLQLHHQPDESEDRINITQLEPGDSYHIRPGIKHRFEAATDDVLLVEVSTTQLEDVVRLEDDYGRGGADSPRARDNY